MLQLNLFLSQCLTTDRCGEVGDAGRPCAEDTLDCGLIVVGEGLRERTPGDEYDPVCMCVYGCMCVWVCMYAYILLLVKGCVSARLVMNMTMYVCMYVFMYVCMHVCVHVCVCECVRIHIFCCW